LVDDLGAVEPEPEEAAGIIFFFFFPKLGNTGFLPKYSNLYAKAK